MKTLLDIGGGNQPHMEEGYETIATDRHDFSADYVGKENCRFVVHDLLTPLPFEDNKFDMTRSHHVYEHLPHQTPDGQDALVYVMREMARVTKVGGQMIIVVPWMKHPNATRHPCHYRFFDHEVFNWFDADYPSPDLEAYDFPRNIKIRRNEIIDECHILAVFEKIK